MNLGGRVAVITGGSRGIGYAVAEAMAKEGVSILLVSRTLLELESAKSKLEKYGQRVEICPADVSKKDDVEKIGVLIKEKFHNQIDILVNAAGVYGSIGPITENDPEDWRRALDINLFGTFLMIRTIAPMMKARKRGKIINFVGGGEGPLPNFSSYVASKGAVARLNESVATELKDFNIDVNAIAPGAVNTRLLENLLAAGPKKVGKEIYERSLRQKKDGGTPPEKVADLAVFLASDISSDLTGKIISATWDVYQKIPERLNAIMNSDVFTVRRVKPIDRSLKSIRKTWDGIAAKKIAVVGLWQLGEIYSVCLAEFGHRVVGISEDQETIKNLLANVPPIAEPGLIDLLKSNQSAGRLFYTNDFSKITESDIVWITFDTPVDEDDNVNLSPIFNAVEKSLLHLRDGVLLIVSSQLPIGTSKAIREMIGRKRPDLKFDYIYSPENLRFGEGVACFLDPDRIVVGAESELAFRKMEGIFGELKSRFIKMSPASAEMSKHALNAFLASSLSFIYDIADACEMTGADVLEVAKALRSDSRIGSGAYLDASAGFSGGTLGRDLQALLALVKNNPQALPVIQSVFRKNRERKQIVLSRIGKELGDLKNKNIAIFGLAYKSGTPALRRSLGMDLANDLEKAGSRIRLHDPFAEHPEILRSPYEAAKDAEAVILMTSWPEFKNLDFVKLSAGMKTPKVLFDTRNLFYDREVELRSAGFKYLGIGR